MFCHSFSDWVLFDFLGVLWVCLNMCVRLFAVCVTTKKKEEKIFKIRHSFVMNIGFICLNACYRLTDSYVKTPSEFEYFLWVQFIVFSNEPNRIKSKVLNIQTNQHWREQKAKKTYTFIHIHKQNEKEEEDKLSFLSDYL